MNNRGYGPRALAGTLRKIAKPLFGRRGFGDGAILTGWPAIVGTEIAAHSAPEKIVPARGGEDGGTLHLRIQSGSLATELQHLEPQVLERINTYFGYRAVGRLKLVQGPLPRRAEPARRPPRPLTADEEKSLAADMETVTDADLRRALESLGRAVAGRNRPGNNS